MNSEQITLLDKLYDTYSEKLYIIARYRLGEEYAKDAVQMVFLIAAKNIDVVFNHSNKNLWLYKTMNNVIKQLLYNKKYTSDKKLREVSIDQIMVFGVSDEYEFDNLGIILELKNVLREKEYRYVTERFVNGHSNQELAGIFNMSYSSITSFGTRVLKKVKKYLEKRDKTHSKIDK
ncbi:MAG: sigma-70 family RNA polymerase sigma factor [Firmicutes bacterium]|nr:sigma-70 family RNA polymerase sigma factor [Bacillota bacterium]